MVEIEINRLVVSKGVVVRFNSCKASGVRVLICAIGHMITKLAAGSKNMRGRGDHGWPGRFGRGLVIRRGGFSTVA